MIAFSRGEQRALLLICVSILLGSIVWMAKHYRPDWFLGKPDYISNSSNSNVNVNTSAIETITVHVLGEVMSPGVYRLPSAARIIDGIKAAGDATQKADLGQLNLAAKLEDGKRLYVPTQEDIKSDKIDINRADLEQLQTLPSIGPAIAKRIIEYRQANGRYETTEQLKEVKGIGEKTFEKVKDRVCVEP